MSHISFGVPGGAWEREILYFLSKKHSSSCCYPSKPCFLSDIYRTTPAITRAYDHSWTDTQKTALIGDASVSFLIKDVGGHALRVADLLSIFFLFILSSCQKTLWLRLRRAMLFMVKKLLSNICNILKHDQQNFHTHSDIRQIFPGNHKVVSSNL